MIIGVFALWTESGCYTRMPQVVWCVLLDEPAFALVVNTNEKTTAERCCEMARKMVVEFIFHFRYIIGCILLSSFRFSYCPIQHSEDCE